MMLSLRCIPLCLCTFYEQVAYTKCNTMLWNEGLALGYIFTFRVYCLTNEIICTHVYSRWMKKFGKYTKMK